ncbi:aspartate/glutamate racemase family protein [Marinomonas mediterranea]|uniref:aspartate/glutamate racemase family protein n=1 Tax=Marinomonas mediterranea TaxID=119864 RepID=UPI0023496FBD|nr:aspartate/glutamate racemase family protein [Marinomonas mediterranea]WCN09821.1 hydantoin racemase [Marinomonas mediterranea]
MTIAIINPNASHSMTQQMQASCLNLSLHNETRWYECLASPVSIEGHSDGVEAAYHLLEKIRQLENSDVPPKAYVIACFDDTGLDAAREITASPVIGIGEAAMHAASFVSQSFVVMTTLERSVSILERNLSHYGLVNRCGGVYASGLPVLSLESNEESYDVVRSAASHVLQENRGDALVLGCGGMSHWVERLQSDIGVPVLDGVRIAITFADGFISLKLATSKVAGYAWPETKA